MFHFVTASAPASRVQYRGVRAPVARKADAPSQARQDSDGGSSWRRTRSK